MANNSPTLVMASLSDDQLKKSINSLVTHVDEAMKKMVQSTNNAVGEMEAKLKSLGNLKIDTGGSNDGGASKRTKAQNAETEAIEKNVAARDKQIKKNQEVAMSFDRMANAQQVAIRSANPSGIRNADTLQTMNIQLDLLRERLREARQQYSSFVALAAHATTTGDKGLFQYATEGVHRYEQEVRSLIPQIRTLQSGIQQMGDVIAPQGHAMQNYVNSLQKANPELAALNAQYKSGTSLLQEQSTSYASATQSAQRYTEEIRKQAAAIRESHQWREKGFVQVDGQVIYNKENESKRKRVALEEQILQLQQQGLYLKQDQATKEMTLVDVGGRRVRVIQEENENLQRQKERVAEIAKEVRDSFSINKWNAISYTPAPLSGTRWIYQENDERAKGLTIEQQIEKILKEQSNEYERQAKAKISNNSNAQRNISDIQAQTRAIEELLSKGKSVTLLGNYKLFPADMTGASVAKQIALYEEQRKAGLIAANHELNLQVELANAIARAEGRITQEQERRKKYVAPTTTDDYRQVLNNAIANKLGIDTSKVINADAQYDSIKHVNNALKQLQDAYTRMSNEERNSPIGKQTIRQMQELERQTQQLRKQMSRPINLKDALSGSEKTLDDIAYKMQRLASYRSGLNVDTQKKEIQQVNDEYNRLKKRMDEVMQKNQNMIASNNALGRSWNYMKNRLAFYFTVGASTQFVKNLIEVRSQYEMNERALGILIDSAERGTQIFNELSQMALVSPYTLIELSTAAKQLTAYDVAAKDVVDTTRRLADMAAAVGIPIERLTYALGQIKAYGYLNSRDARMFANAGIPLVKQLSDYYTELEGRLVSTADVYDRIKKKAIDYNEVMEVINKMTDQGGKFFDFQAKMADTLKVQLANLTLAWNNMLNEIGKSNQGLLTYGIGALKELFLQWRKFSSAIYSAAWAGGLVVAIRALNVLLVKAGFNFRILSKDMTTAGIAGQGLATKMRTLGSSIASVAKSSMTWWTLLAFAVVDAAKDLYYMNEAQENLNKSIRDGAKDNYDNISKFLEQYKEVRESLYSTRKAANPTTRKAEATSYAEQQVGQDIDKNEAKKAWEAIREQIELTSQSSDVYISKLLTIENMSERVRQGFNVLDDIQVVNAALKEIDDDTIKMSASLSAWWNLWSLPDGLIDNLQDYKNAIDDTENSWKKAGKTIASLLNPLALYTGGTNIIENYIKDSDDKLNDFREDLKVTTDSILNFIELKGWSGDEGKINQVFEQLSKKLVLDNQLDPNSAFIMQTEIEEARSKAAKEALEKRIADEKAALALAETEEEQTALRASIGQNEVELVNFEKYNGRKKVEWERFTKWLKEQHISETTAMFRNMDAEDIKSLNFQEGKHAEWVTRMVTQYAKEHKMSYDEAFGYLKHWVSNANQWSIFLPLIISTEDKKSVYDQLGEYDKAIDDADSQIARLTRRIGELREKRKLDKKELQELVHAQQELTDAEKAKADAEAKGGHGKKEAKDEKAARKAADKAAKQAETELQKVLKDELSTIEKVRSIYKDLTKEGMSHANAVERATRGWNETVNAINRVLQKNGLQKLDLSKFAGIDNPRELVNMLQSQLNTLLKRGAKPAEIKELQTKIQTLNVDAEKYDLTKITKGLNNELGKLKDEYELAVELDANPELGNIFADFMGINIDDLPRTFQDAAKKAQEGIDEVFERYGRTDKIDIASMLNKESFDKWVKESGLDLKGNLVQEVENFRQFLHKVQVDENKNITQGWANLVQKYGDLQSKLLKIYKESVQEQMNIVRKFGDSGEIAESLDLSKQINLSQDPAEIARLQEQLARIIKSVVDRNPKALNFTTAIENKTKTETAKATWEDFKNSDIYTMTFEDMSYNSTRAIQLIIDKLNALKDKVKEDPASMKALMKSLEDAEKELNARDPFGGIVRSINSMAEASKETKLAQQDLVQAEKDVAQAQQKVDESEDATPEERASAQQKLADAVQRRAAAQQKLTQAENKGKKAQENLKSSLQGISNQLGNVQNLFGEVSKLFRAGGDDETADAIDAISEGFSIMTTVIMGVVAAMVILESTTPWLLAIAAALSVVVGLFSFLSGNEDNKITEKVEESERAVKRLELAYVDLQHAVDRAYGTAVIGARQATLENKKLQLAELQRQIQLEKSRDSKNRDEDKIIDLQKQYRELFYEIQDGYKEIVDDLMGTDVASFAENLVSSMIDAFKQGEDYMKVFSDKFDEMVDNMIMKSIVSRVVAQYMDNIWESIDSRINERSRDEAEEYEKAQQEAARRASMNDAEIIREMYGAFGIIGASDEDYKRIADEYRKAAMDEEKAAKERLDAATMFADSDIDYVMSRISEVTPELGEKLKAILGQYYTFGETSDKQLSSLQQGIAGVSEDTASAVESYLNGMSQQAYLRNDLLVQIRDTIMSFDMDVQLGVFSQMLLQLQQSYQVQQNVESILTGVLNPSGRAFTVELAS